MHPSVITNWKLTFCVSESVYLPVYRPCGGVVTETEHNPGTGWGGELDQPDLGATPSYPRLSVNVVNNHLQDNTNMDFVVIKHGNSACTPAKSYQRL